MSLTFTPPLDALTTIFTPPCPTSWLLTTTKLPSQYPPFPTGPASCNPPQWAQYIEEEGFEYYSPAICPTGFVVGPSCIISNPRTSQGFPAIAGGETAAYCVPSGHTCTSDTTDFRGGVWGVLRTATGNGVTVTVGPAIQIRWKDGDLGILETDPLTPGLPRATPIAAAPEPTATEPPPTPTPIRQVSDAQTEPRTLQTSTIIRADPTTNAPPPQQFTNLPFPLSDTSVSTELPTTTSERSMSITTPLGGGDVESSSTLPSSITTTQGAATTTGSADASNDTNERPPISGFSMAAVILTGILIATLSGYLAFVLFRRYRRCRAGEISSFIPLGIKGWTQQNFGAPARRRDRPPPIQEKSADDIWTPAQKRFPDAELGTDGPIAELPSPQLLGSADNPAELSAVSIGESNRWSWMSRMSKKMFSVALTRKDSLPSSKLDVES